MTTDTGLEARVMALEAVNSRQGGGTTGQSMQRNGGLVTRIATAARSDTTGVRNGQTNYYLSGTTMTCQVFDAAQNAWYDVGAAGTGTGSVTHTPGPLTLNQIVLGNGADDEKTLGTLGTTTTLLHGNAAGAPTFGQVSLTADVAGVLPVANFATGTPNGTKFVRDDGVLAMPSSSSGTVTSVDLAAPAAGITVAGSPITTNGTMTLALADDLAALEGLATTGIARRTGASAWSAGTAVGLTTEVTGTLPVANGGTGDATLTAYAVLAGGTTTTGPMQSVASVGTAGQVLTSNGAGALPTFQDSSAAVGLHAIAIVAGSQRPSATGGCSMPTAIVSAANQPDIVTLNFDPTTQEFSQFSIPMPKSWNEGTITAKFYWSHPATTTNFGVVWQLQGVAVSDNDPIAVAYGTAQTVTDTGGTTNNLYESAATAAITIAGTPAAEDMVFFRVARNAADGSDTLAVDARLHAVVIYITTDAGTDT